MRTQQSAVCRCPEGNVLFFRLLLRLFEISTPNDQNFVWTYVCFVRTYAIWHGFFYRAYDYWHVFFPELVPIVMGSGPNFGLDWLMPFGMDNLKPTLESLSESPWLAQWRSDICKALKSPVHILHIYSKYRAYIVCICFAYFWHKICIKSASFHKSSSL